MMITKQGPLALAPLATNGSATQMRVSEQGTRRCQSEDAERYVRRGDGRPH